MGTQTHHREQVRQKIIQSALQLFNRHGFTAASIDDIMAGAGMTRGGFYSYFQSKSELYAEAISCFVTEKQEVTSQTPRRHRTVRSRCCAIICRIRISKISRRAVR